MTEGIVLGHYISTKGIEVDPKKVKIIQTCLFPLVKRMYVVFWVMLDIIDSLFKTSTKLPHLFFFC